MSFLPVLLSFLFLIVPFGAYAESIAVESIMTKEDMEKIGLDKATDAQKKAFNDWIGRWTKKVLDQSPSYHPSMGLNEWIRSWPGFVAPAKVSKEKEKIEEREKANRQIDKNLNDGGTLELKNGSVWEIAEIDRYKTRRWLRGDTIEWEQTVDDVAHPYRLTDVTRRQTALGTMIRGPSPTGQKTAENKDYYKDSVRVLGVRRKGEYLDLANKSSWKIALRDQIRVNTWKSGDRIRIGPHDDFLYPFELTNLDSGESALANPAEE